VLGAIVGALLDGQRGAARGAAIGAGVGGVAGYAYGHHVANQKARYASREEWLDACQAQAEKSRQSAVESNERLSEELVRLDKETRALETAYRKKKASRADLLAEEQRIRQRVAETEKLIQGAETEITLQNSVVQEARAGGDEEKAARLEAEVRGLREQVEQLKEQSSQLATMSHRMTV
jgi:chromosome segregation ATPase